MTEKERQKAEENGILLFVIVMILWTLAGCCSAPQVKGDMTPENDCLLIQAGFATLDQLPKMLK